MNLTIASFIGNGALMLLLLTGYFYHEHTLDVKETEKTQAVDKAKKDQKAVDDAAQTPTQKADEHGYETLMANYNTCLGKLRQSAKCTPIYISKIPGNPAQNCPAPAAGLTNGAIEAKNLEHRQCVDMVNTCVIFGQEYNKYIEQHQ